MTSQGRRWWVSVLAAIALMLAQDAGAQNTAPTAEGAPAPAQRQTVAGSNRGFSADMPAAPKYSSVQMKTAAGSVYTMHQYLLEQGNVAFWCRRRPIPTMSTCPTPEPTCRGLDNAAKNMEGGKWISIDWLTHQGSVASDAVGSREGNAIRSFSVMKGRQIFTLTYAGPPGTARSADVNRFVGSLRVGP